MQSMYHLPQPGPETEAQKERRKYIGLMIERTKADRRDRWQQRTQRIRQLFRK